MNLSRLRYLLSLTDGSPFNATTRQESVHQSFISRYSISSNTNISDVLKVITPSRPGLVSDIFHKTPSRRCSVHQSCMSQIPYRAYRRFAIQRRNAPRTGPSILNVSDIFHNTSIDSPISPQNPKARFNENTCLRQLHTLIYYVTRVVLRLGHTKALLFIQLLIEIINC